MSSGVLLDAMIPAMDGFELVAQVGADPILVGVVTMMLTSSAPKGDIERCKRLGVAAHLTKPIRQRELWDALMTVLGGVHARGIPPLPRPIGGPPGGLGVAARPLRILLVEDLSSTGKWPA